MRLLTWIILVLSVTGCTSLSSPSSNLINEKPVIKMGSDKPEHDDYILFIPADQEFPIELEVAGSMINKTGKAEATVSLNRDVYLYKYWASYNGKEWQRLKEAFGLKLSAGMQADGGMVTIELEDHQ